MSNPFKFAFVGSILEVMLEKLPNENEIVNKYRKKFVSSVRPMPDELRTEIEEASKPKRGAKRKGKVGPSETVKTLKKKVKKVDRKPKSPSLVHDDSDSRTHSDLREGEHVQTEVDDTAATLEPPTSNPIPKVSTPPTSSTPDSKFFHMPTPPPSLTTTSSPITTTIPIFIAPLPNFYVGVSQPQIYVPLSTPLYTDSTSTTTTISTLMSTVNVSNTGAYYFVVSIGTSTSTTSPLRADDPDLIFGDDQEVF